MYQETFANYSEYKFFLGKSRNIFQLPRIFIKKILNKSPHMLDENRHKNFF